MFCYAYAKAEETQNNGDRPIYQAIRDRYFLFFIFQVVGASGFLIQSFYGSIINENQATWDIVAKVFFILGALSAFGLFVCSAIDLFSHQEMKQSAEKIKIQAMIVSP
jgi:hypothetical protein